MAEISARAKIVTAFDRVKQAANERLDSNNNDLHALRPALFPREYGLHDRFVPLVTRALKQSVIRVPQPNHSGPRSYPSIRIVECHLVMDFIRRNARQTFNQVKFFGHTQGM